MKRPTIDKGMILAAAEKADLKDAAVDMIERLEAAEKELAELRSSMKFRTSLLGRTEAERDALRAEVETTENDAAHQKALADSALRVAEGWERKCGELRVALRHEADCLEAAKAEIDALRAKITEMEKQEPVAWRTFDGEGGYDYRSYEDNENYKLGWDARNPNHIGWVEPLYALPGAQAQPAQKAVAYLDLGVGGYVDVGTDLTDEALAALPKGRHMLGIVGTYGVDGYVPAQPAPSVPDGVAEALQRLIENGAVLGPGSSEDALLVARYRQHLLSSAPSISPAALRPVIQWLRNGCDPMKAAKELEILIAAAPEAKP